MLHGKGTLRTFYIATQFAERKEVDELAVLRVFAMACGALVLHNYICHIFGSLSVCRYGQLFFMSGRQNQHRQYAGCGNCDCCGTYTIDIRDDFFVHV